MRVRSDLACRRPDSVSSRTPTIIVSYKFILQSSVLTIFGEAVQVLNKGVHRFTGVLSSSIRPCLFNDNIAAGCKITIEGCFDFFKGSGCFVYA